MASPRNGRVQVRDLEAPEKLVTAPLQSDTFSQAAPPVVDNSLSQLADALGMFSRNVTALGRQQAKLADQREHDMRLQEWEHLKATSSSTEILDGIRSGALPWYADPYIGHVVRKDYANLESQAFANGIDQDIAEGKIRLGDASFNPDAYIVEKARPLADKMVGSVETMTTFRGNLETIRKSLTERHQKATAEHFAAYTEDIARRQLDAALEAGLAGGLRGAQLNESVRAVYKDLGPRMKGGSLDLKYNELDRIYLDVLEQRAGQIEFAPQVADLLAAPRVRMDGSPGRLGSLAETNAHAGRVRNIVSIAQRTLGDAAEKAAINTYVMNDVEALKRADGSFGTLTDIRMTNPSDPTREITISADKRKKEALRAFWQQMRAPTGGKPDPDRELDYAMRNGVPHEEFVGYLQNVYAGAANVLLAAEKGGGIPADQLGTIQKAAQLYNMMADKSFSYTEQQLGKAAVEFFEMYTGAIRHAGMVPEQAAAAVARAYASKLGKEDPSLNARRRDDLENKARNIDLNGWWPGGGVTNPEYVRGKLTDLAELYMKTGFLDADKAIAAARDRIANEGVRVNGFGVFGVPGFTRGDEKHVQPILNDIFKKHAGALKALGVSSGSDLSIVDSRGGDFFVIHRNPAAGGAWTPLVVPSGDPNRPFLQPRIPLSAIQRMRAAQEHNDREAQLRRAMRGRAESPVDPAGVTDSEFGGFMPPTPLP